MKPFLLILLISPSLFLGQTTEQIKKAKEIIQRTGMSEKQVRDAAKSRGYTDKQIDDVIQKEKSSQIKSEQRISDISEKVELPDNGKSNELIQEKAASSLDENTLIEEFDLDVIDETEFSIESKTETARQDLTYFGYDIFKRDPALFQATSVGAADPDYLIGPGDEIIVMLWGETQFRQVLIVDREGFVFIPEVGQVFVNGLNLNLLESKIFRVFSQSYASLDPQGATPTTFLDVSLGNLRPLRIQVLGEVAQPGAYTVSPSATLFSALYYFNGPTTLGSLRDIHLIRGGKKIASIDFYDYLLTGKKLKDQKLQLDDVIFVPRRMKTVTIAGEINRSGIYELKPKESLGDLINIAGSLKITAYMDRAQIDRIVPFEDRKELGMDRVYTDVNLDKELKSEKKFSLLDGDKIKIFSVLDLRQNVVEIRGAVTRPGNYDLGDSLSLGELINKADGLLGDAYLERIDIIRTRPDFKEELIKLDLGKAMEGNQENNIFLQGFDRVQVYSITDMVERTYVSILGHVKRPGRFPLQKNMTVYDLIFKAGGIIDEEFKKQTFMGRADLIRLNDDNITRRIKSFNLGELLESPDSKVDFPLQANDIVRIYSNDLFSSNKTITVNGVVRNPGSYLLKTNMTLKDLILEAGGLNDNVYRYRVEVARIDPLNKDLNQFAKIITFDIDREFAPVSSSYNDNSNGKTSAGSVDFKLFPYDLISIRPDPFFKEQKQVTIVGEVLYPGEYTIIGSDEKITGIIDRAGGLLSSAYPEASQYFRKGLKINASLGEIIKNPNSKLNFKVQNGDRIVIVSHPNTINILGEVNNIGTHKYVPGKRLKYYLDLAGGLNQNADKGNIWVNYPNGDSKKYNKYSLISPKIIDGSSITVGRAEEKEPLDKTEFAKELTAIFANLAQALAVVVLAAR